jgi:hypothetical protein
MKKLFTYVLFLLISLNLAAQTEQKQTQTESQETPKQEDVYTKDFLTKFADTLYLEKENPKAALKNYEELFNQAPNDITLLESLSELCFVTNDKPCAEKYVPLYLKEDPQNSQALAFSAQLAWQKGNLKQAQEYYAAALKNGGQQNQNILMQYLTLLNAIDKEEAIKFLKELEQENNLLYLPINLEIAQVYLNQNDTQKALLTLDNAIKKHPQTKEFYLAKAKIYEIKKDINKMLSVYEEMDKEGLLDAEDLVKIGAYYTLQNKPKDAYKYYLRAYELEPSHPQACEFLSLWEQSQKNYLKAESYLRQSESFKTNPSLRVKQVHLLKLAGEQQKALTAMQQAYQDFNDSIEIGFYYALLLEDNKDYKQAGKVLEKLLEKQADNEEFLLSYAYTLQKTNNHKKMQKVLEQIINKNPKNDEALNFLGYYLVDQTKQIEKGGEYIKQAIALNPKNGATIDSLAWYYYKKGDYKKSLNLLENLPIKYKSDPEIVLHLAKVYQSLDDISNALKYYQLLLNSDEYGTQAQKAINKINKK